MVEILRHIARFILRVLWCGGDMRMEKADIGETQLQAIRLMVATEMCRAGESALRSGDIVSAMEHAAEAAKVDSSLPRLVELQAILTLKNGKSSQALDILSGSGLKSGRARLLLELVRMQTGQRELANMELSDWSRSEGCSSAARVLLARCSVLSGDIKGARVALARNLRDGADSLTCRMQYLLDLREELPEAMRRSAGMLLHAFDNYEMTDRFVESMLLADDESRGEIPIEAVEHLACELLREPDVIPTLVVGQRVAMREDRVELLRRSIRRVVHDLPDPAMGMEALVVLSKLIGDVDDARRWARRGLHLMPTSASLALLLDELTEMDGEEEEWEEPAVEVLARVAEVYPQYADVQYAMVQRYLRNGMKREALVWSRDWAAREPHQPLAQRAMRELAA